MNNMKRKSNRGNIKLRDSLKNFDHIVLTKYLDG